ncbi:MAG: aromatic acid exporter family protein [Aerococcus suis]|nr:aromatic acid exporter family protein [Aerococcus suis]
MEALLKAAKYAVVTFLAVTIANIVGLEYEISAGIIAILSLAETNRATIQYIERITLTMVLSLIIASVLFSFLGFHVWIFALYLLITYPITVQFNSHQAIAPCAVAVSHLLQEQSVSVDWMFNEFLLLVIGTGVAFLVNLYQPKRLDQIENYKEKVEEDMKAILTEFADYLLADDAVYEGSISLVSLQDHLREAITLVQTEGENRLTDNYFYYREYFDMREAQTRLLYEMDESLRELGATSPEYEALAEFLHHTSDKLHEKNTGIRLQEDLKKVEVAYQETPLPQSRAEFEERAVLYEVLLDCRKFVQLKKDFARRLRFMHVKRTLKND